MRKLAQLIPLNKAPQAKRYIKRIIYIMNIKVRKAETTEMLPGRKKQITKLNLSMCKSDGLCEK